jgi:enoyl-CoA hydratase/carnithine racemase
MVALTRAVAPKHAMEMLLTGELISAAEAHRIGLVNRVVPDDELDHAVASLADLIASKPPETVAIGKAAFGRIRALPLADAYADASDVMACNLGMDEASEGISAFLEKRPPRWSTT